jgi:formylglycine-generating enzyme required for sulfatase activity
VVLAVIGRDWLRAADAGSGRRLDAPRDYVRTEIEIALARGIPLVPVLLEGVAMPLERDLPDSIKALADRQGTTVHAAGAHFRGHMDRLIRGIERLAEHPHPAAPPAVGSAARTGAAPSNDLESKASTSAPTAKAEALDSRGPVGSAVRTSDPASAALPGRTIKPPAPAPKTEPLLAELADPATKTERRLEIGDQLAELGDPRPGVGLDSDGRPAIGWVEIPAGSFLYGAKKERRDNDAFRIGRVPITNVQYQAFIAAGGYTENRWWEGLERRIESPIEPNWEQPNRPRERVYWCEAMAYCAWLSDTLQLDVRLPTEWEWERAARGTDGREYPWGDGYRAGYANINETNQEAGPSYLQQTTAVGTYPQAVAWMERSGIQVPARCRLGYRMPARPPRISLRSIRATLATAS